MIVETDAALIARAAKWAFTTRRVDRSAVAGLDRHVAAARPGDLVLARVERIGAHKRVQLVTGRPAALYVGDLVVVACGARYAPDQFEGLATLAPEGADLLAGGGVVGTLREANARMGAPTRLSPIGLLCGRDGRAINLADHALTPRARPDGMVVIAGTGAAMNAGKTTAIACLAHGLTRAGHRVAALKATGTGACGDVNAYHDAGAAYVADFVDAGMASTYREPHERLVAGLDTLLGHAGRAGCSVALVELADGLFQRETAALMADPAVRARFDGVLYAARDAASAAGGVALLRGLGIEPAVLTGLIAASPLAVAEAGAALSLQVADRDVLADPAHAGALLARILAGRGMAAVDMAAGGAAGGTVGGAAGGAGALTAVRAA
ncbi:MAG: DUF1611 domain-containing protein [Pseudomonadota bacterium]